MLRRNVGGSSRLNCFQRNCLRKYYHSNAVTASAVAAVLKSVWWKFWSCRDWTQGPAHSEWIRQGRATTDRDCQRSPTIRKSWLRMSQRGTLDPDNSWEIMNLLERIKRQGPQYWWRPTHRLCNVSCHRHRDWNGRSAWWSGRRVMDTMIRRFFCNLIESFRWVWDEMVTIDRSQLGYDTLVCYFRLCYCYHY